jgi:hypothetical protein
MCSRGEKRKAVMATPVDDERHPRLLLLTPYPERHQADAL